MQFQRLTADATGHRRARVDDPLAFVSGASFTGEGDRMDDELIALAPNINAPHRRAALRAALAAFERGDTG